MTPPLSVRPFALAGHTLSLETHCGRLYITVNRDVITGMPVEVFCRFGKAGGCGSAIMDGMTRMISFGLRSGMSPEEVVRGLQGIACHKGPKTCMDALSRGVATIMASITGGLDPNEIISPRGKTDKE